MRPLKRRNFLHALRLQHQRPGGYALPEKRTAVSELAAAASWRMCATAEASCKICACSSALEDVRYCSSVLHALRLQQKRTGGCAHPQKRPACSVLAAAAPWRLCATAEASCKLCACRSSALEDVRVRRMHMDKHVSRLTSYLQWQQLGLIRRR